MSQSRRGLWNEYGIGAFVGLAGLGILFGDSEDDSDDG